MGRQLRTRLDLVIPDLPKHVKDNQRKQKDYHDQHSRSREFRLGDRVLSHNYSDSPHWLPGTVKAILGPVSYQVELKDGRIWKRHQDQLLKDHSQQLNDCADDKDIIDFPLSEPTATTEDQPLRHSSRVRQPPDKLTL